ncbi:hypothetical protein MAMC_01004 [Methylacidimicrobium cyclopophantes]|uniref:Uncharacterized protein n=1 Tax=Methylacidimicrobium cyclopophantes TaxID=1041766 RepID=A0A5E6MA12_9BACT|nr:hypothetical protein [Methylacidimicrobium cyclopophantes]VVM06235.1 hypothetical protein MAMC_01004 [Methylacidimicrobium cyclopophantes]
MKMNGDDREPLEYRPLFPIAGEVGNLAFFALLDDPDLRTPVALAFPPEKAHPFALWLTTYPPVVAYFGQSRVVERLCEEHIGLYGSLAASWKESLKASSLIHQAISVMATDYLWRYLLWSANRCEGELSLPISAMMGWILHEGASFFLRDYLPLLGKGRNALMEDVAAVAQAARDVQELFAPLSDGFSEEENPYQVIGDLRDAVQIKEAAEELVFSGSAPLPPLSKG